MTPLRVPPAAWNWAVDPTFTVAPVRVPLSMNVPAETVSALTVSDPELLKVTPLLVMVSEDAASASLLLT